MPFLRASAPAWLLAVILSALLVEGIPAQGNELLENGGFEEGTDPWVPLGGELTASLAGEGRGGSVAGLFTADEGSLHNRVSQCVPAWEGGEYEFVAYLARPSASSVVEVRLNTVWYDRDACRGDQVSARQTLGMLSVEDAGHWYGIEAAFSGEPRSRSASLEVSLEFADGAQAVVYLDDFSLRGPAAPPPTPTPTVIPPLTATPTPTATPQPTPSPAPSPQATPLPTQPITPPKGTVVPSPSAHGDAASSPSVGVGLINGGFEEAATDGRLLGWGKYGGEVERSAVAKMEGGFSAAFISRTDSTKWVFQTVQVKGDKAYELSGYALKNDPNVEAAYLRLSWYASADSSGQAIGSVDSTIRLTDDSSSFRHLTTGAVVAPAEASSAKARLMLDPASAATAVVYFDAISFVETEVPPPNSEDQPAPTPIMHDEGPPSPTPVPTQESPPSPTLPPPTSSSPAQSSGQATPVPSVSPTSAQSSSPSGSPTTSVATAVDGERAPAIEESQDSRDGRDHEKSLALAPPVLYRERRPSTFLETPQSAEVESGGSAAWPLVAGLAGLAAALGLGGGFYFWHQRGKRGRSP